METLFLSGQGRETQLISAPISSSELIIPNEYGNVHWNRTKVAGKPLASLLELPSPQGEMLCETLGKCWPVLGEEAYQAIIPYPQKPIFPLDEVIFFAGSFHPWHLGHRSCVELCPKKEKLIIIPDRNPQKEHFPAWKNYQEILQATKDLPSQVYPGFYGKKKNPTSAWIKKLQEQQPKLKITLLMGDDSFLSIPHWINGSDLLKGSISFYIVLRHCPEKEVLDFIQKYSVPTTILGKSSFPALSSTQLRPS